MSPQRQDAGQQAPAAPRAPQEAPPEHRDAGSHGASAAPSRPAPRPASKPAPPLAGPRRVRLTVARVDPWSVMKLAFLLSVAVGIALVVAAAVLWSVLDGMGVYQDVDRIVREILADPSFTVHDYIGFNKVVSLATVVAVVDVVLATAIATLVAFLYNLATALVGGLHVTLSDD